MANLFTSPPRAGRGGGGVLVAPSILSADFARMAEDCESALRAGGDLLHVDVMDGHFVPNLTMGPDMVKGLRRALPDAFLDVHLMVTEPANFVEPFATSGANHLTFHVEVLALEGLRDLAQRVRSLGCTAGVAINPPTPVDRVLPVVPDFDLILVMSVNPGFGGQRFIREVLDKTRAIKRRLEPHQRLEMDGGIDAKTAREVREAGCDVLVAGSAVFGVPTADRGKVIGALRTG